MVPELLPWIALSPAASLWAGGTILTAAVIRGYSGFGFSALMVAGLTLILPPAEVIPIAFLLEIAASLHMLPLVWKEVDWKRLRLLGIGMLLATPLGVHLLSILPERTTRWLVLLLVLAASMLLLRGFRLSGGHEGRGLTLSVGLFSGLVNGSTAVGGLPVVLFLLSTSTGAAISRASMVAYLFASDVVAVSFSGFFSLITRVLLFRTFCFLPLLFLGIALGHRGFIRTDPRTFRMFTLSLLIVLCLLGMGRMLLDPA